MLDLFRVETENQALVLSAGLLALERDPAATDPLEACMRAAHSLKGAARIVDLAAGVRVAHVLEDCFVAAQQGRITLRQDSIDLLLRGVDLLSRMAQVTDAGASRGIDAKDPEVEALVAALTRVLETPTEIAPVAEVAPERSVAQPQGAPAVEAQAETIDRVLRVTAENLNRLLGLAGESLVESRRLGPFSASLLRLKRQQHDLARTLDHLREVASEPAPPGQLLAAVSEARTRVVDCQQALAQRLAELEIFQRRSSNLSHRLYDEALACRMRPFVDGTRAFPRMVRDVARTLGKQVRLEIVGEATQVDRDILGKLDAPLGHLLRNAIDHGVGTPEERRAAGKPAEGVVRLDARHSAGTLQITVSDDGRGIDCERLRKAVVDRNLTDRETAHKLSEGELLEFLFLPGFSLKDSVTEISGRGVGLDVVKDMVRQVGGSVRVMSQAGKGTRFQLQLPLTLSVVRTLIAEIGGEPYAFPLAYIVRTLKLPKVDVERLEGRQHFTLDGRQIGLVSAHQVFGGSDTRLPDSEWPVIVLGQGGSTYGLVVDRFLGERELVVQPLNARLGKIKDVAACALMDDGSPVLIVDAEDVIRSVEKRIVAGELGPLRRETAGAGAKKAKRVLVVEDSLTVRELERKLLANRGYEVEIAVDGMDGWNAVRTGHFNLVVTDIDMPRMDGIELVTLIKKDPNLKSTPVLVVSYKEREEDRQRGLEAGADYYLSKSSFHDETLLQAVVDLIGEADA